MSRLKIITKYFIRNAIDEMFSGSKMKPGLLIALMLFTVSMISLPITFMIVGAYDSFHTANQEGILLSLIFSLGSTISFFFGVYTIMNVFYFSEDIEVILPLPFKSSEIVFGKFAAALINMYIYTGMLILPLIAYGIESRASIMYYLYGIIALVITPILPMIYASLICMVLMRFTNLSKHKDAFRMVSGCLSLILIVGFNYFNSNMGKSMDSGEMLQKMSEGNNSLLNVMNSIFITDKLTAFGLLYNNSINGLLFIILSLLIGITAFLIYYFVGGKLYMKGIIGISEAYSKRENILENGKAHKLTKKNSPIKALVIRDIKIIFRTPQFFINCVAMLLYMPAILGMGIFSNGQINHIKSLLSTNGTSLYGIAIVAAFIVGTTCVMGGGAGSTALSREGRDFLVSKYIPVHYKTQLYSKIISSLCINQIGTIIVAIILILVGASPILFVLGVISSFAGIFFVTIFGMYIDYRSPKLNWENEKAMYKNNYMPLFIMLIIFIQGALLVILALIIKNYLIIFLMTIGVVSIASFIFYKGLVKHARRVYREVY
jgi:ABC-2 type transport system permease protein